MSVRPDCMADICVMYCSKLRKLTKPGRIPAVSGTAFRDCLPGLPSGTAFRDCLPGLPSGIASGRETQHAIKT